MDDRTLRGYVASAILPSMGLKGRFFVVEPAPVRGSHSSLYLIRVDDLSPLLLRVLRHRRQAARNVRALRHLEVLGLAAPRLVFHDLSWRFPPPSWRGHSFPFITVETWIEGTRLSQIQDPDLSKSACLKVAALLACYREVTQRGWGRPGSFHLLSYAAHTLRDVRRMVSRLRLRGWLAAKEASAVQKSFARWRDEIADLRTFNLVHKDANPSNFIMMPTGKVVPVDLHRIAYEPFPEEVINALHHFCPNNRALAEQFLEIYFGRNGDAPRSVFERTRDFFVPLYYLKKLYRRAIAARAIDAPRLDRWRRAVLAIVPPAGTSR